MKFCTLHASLLLLVTFLSAPAMAQRSKARVWRDKSGTFEVEAVLVEYADGKARLRKNDGRVVTVPLSALSSADQAFLKSMEKANPFAGGVPAGDDGKPRVNRFTNPGNVQELPVNGRTVFLDVRDPLPPLPPDPVTHQPAKFKKTTCLIDSFDAYARVGEPILLDPATNTYAMSVHRKKNAVAQTQFGRVYLMVPGKRAADISLDQTESFKLLDHHVQANVSVGIAGVGDNTERGGDLVLVEGLASSKPIATVRWHLPEWQKPGFKPKVEYARLLDASRVVAKVNNVVYLWDLRSGKCEWKFKMTYNDYDISGGGKYLAVPVSKGCRVIDVAKGELIGTVPFPSTLNSTPRFTRDGKRLALVAGNEYVVWDLPEAKTAHENKVGSVSGKFVGWVDDKYLLTTLGGLVDPEMGIAVWNYSLSGALIPRSADGGVAIVENYRPTIFHLLPIPHAPAADSIARLSQGKVSVLVGPGSAVAIEVVAPDNADHAALQAKLAEAIRKQGWRVSQSSPIRLRAEISQGKSRKVYYRGFGSSIFDPHEEATLSPYLLTMQVSVRGNVVWRRSPMTMIPSVLRPEPGESIQDALNKFSGINPNYIDYVSMPSKILDPAISQRVKRSRLKEGNWVE